MWNDELRQGIVLNNPARRADAAFFSFIPHSSFRILHFPSLTCRRTRRRDSGNIFNGRRMGHNNFSNQPHRTIVLTVGSREARLSQLFAKEVRGQALRLAKG
jgi:hypothetical protein